MVRRSPGRPRQGAEVKPRQPALPGIEPPRFPGVDADGYGTHDVHAAVPHGPYRGRRSQDLWDPYDGFVAPARPPRKKKRR